MQDIKEISLQFAKIIKGDTNRALQGKFSMSVIKTIWLF